jgi:hypothetical protein
MENEAELEAQHRTTALDFGRENGSETPRAREERGRERRKANVT